jgi:hypothetical protein
MVSFWKGINGYDTEETCSSVGKRVPTIDELMTLIKGCNVGFFCELSDPDCLEYTCDDDCETCEPAQGGHSLGYYIPDALMMPDDNKTGVFWSKSETFFISENHYWAVDFITGETKLTIRTASKKLRCVE